MLKDGRLALAALLLFSALPIRRIGGQAWRMGCMCLPAMPVHRETEEGLRFCFDAPGRAGTRC